MTVRAVVIGLVLCVLNTYWIMANFMWRQAAPATVSLFYNVVFSLLVVALLNVVIRGLWPKWAFSRGELTVLYVMMAIASAVSGHDMSHLHHSLPLLVRHT